MQWRNAPIGIGILLAFFRLRPSETRPVEPQVQVAIGAVRGQVNRLDSVEVEGRTVRGLDAMVADGLKVSLLGQDFLKHMGSITMARDVMVLR